MPKPAAKEIILKGINASPGICIGKAYLVDKEGVDVVQKYSIPQPKIKKEIQRFEAAVKKVKDQIREIIDTGPEELQQIHILETHIVLLKDKMLYGKTIETIKAERVNAEWALKTVVANLKAIFQNMTDPYLRERASDVVHVCDSIMRNLVGATRENIANIDKRVILVARDLSPADTSQINLERIMGFITDLGGKASHTGIIARSLEIPAVVGLGHATKTITNEALIIIDGSTGTVIVHPTEKTLVEYEERKSQYEAFKAVISRDSHKEAKTTDGVYLEVMGNIELPEEVFAVINYGGDGIGLYRTEFQYLGRAEFPGEQELFDKYRNVVEVMTPKPVTIRTLDINGDKAVSNSHGPIETNPALGLRAIRYCLKKPDVFKTQLRAILRAAAYGPVRIMFPMISALFEIRMAKRFLDEAADSLEKEGLPFNRDIDVGIMIEVPSAVIMADLMAAEVDFFSIGTNDLIQYSLAIDRGNRQVAHLYQPLDPAIVRMVNHVAQVAKDTGTEVFMCGEMASTPQHLPILLGMGLDELSMNPQSIPLIKRIIRALNLGETQALTREALKQTTARDVFELVRHAYGEMIAELTHA